MIWKSRSRVFMIGLGASVVVALSSCHHDDDDSRDQFRSIDGSDNHPWHWETGAAYTQLRRLIEPYYTDGVYSMSGYDRPSPREISNAVHAQSQSIPNTLQASDYLWQWGQFLDHDISLTGGTTPAELANIVVPEGDEFFDPDGTGIQVMTFNRSLYDPSTGTGRDNLRQQVNEITSWIDASNVYGSDPVRAAALRTNDGSGRLKTSGDNLLPWNTETLPNAPHSGNDFFLAGDVRANETVSLIALHTVFVREHNRLADKIAAEHPSWSGERVYQKARQIVGAQMQVITYQEFLPALLGKGVIAPYRGYNPMVDASISNVFSTAAFRFGHSAVNPVLLRLDALGHEISAGHIAIREAFFSPQRIIQEGGIDPILRGLAHQLAQRIDPHVIDDLRSFLFGSPGHGGFDLVSLNIQRGRDHGLPSYNKAREAFGLSRANSFADISLDLKRQQQLASVYVNVDDVDLWVAGLSENPVTGSHLGELFHTIVKQQFEALRDGDRFWYQLTLSEKERRDVENTKLSDIIRRNTAIGDELSDDVFRVD